MITLCVLVYIVWTIARFHKGRYMGWTKFGYGENAPMNEDIAKECQIKIDI